jgi:Rad3-related DNA helicase
MVGSGMYEGVSLDEDLARWQIICKVPWPSLAEPAMKYLATEDKEYYANRTIKDIVQTYGRVCRGPTDSGTTLIWDNTFERLLKEHSSLFPKWFLDARI